MSVPEISAVLDRQLLLQLGDRLRSLRKALGLGTEVMAARAGITRNTLRAVETGDPGTAIGTYIRVMSILGVSGELALLVGDSLSPAPSGSAAARSRRRGPSVQVHVSDDGSRHQRQDLQSLALHAAAVQWIKDHPESLVEARSVLERWLATGDVRSGPLWLEWRQILKASSWRKVLGRSSHAQQLRQASPLVTVLPAESRERIQAELVELRRGVTFGNDVSS